MRSCRWVVPAAISLVSLFLAAPPCGAVTILAHYPFDEGSGLSAADATGNQPLASLLNGAGWTTPANARFGNSALALDGSNDFVNANASVLDGTQSFSVSAWVNVTSNAGWRTAVSQDGVNISRFYLQIHDPTDGFGLGVHAGDNTSGTKTEALRNAAASTGAWYHIIGIQDAAANTLQLFVDGVAYPGSPVSYGAGYEWAALGNTIIGAARWGAGSRVDYFPGRMDEVWLFQGTLTGSEIQNLYQTNTLEAIPEPASLLLLASALAALRCRRRRAAGSE